MNQIREQDGLLITLDTIDPYLDEQKAQCFHKILLAPNPLKASCSIEHVTSLELDCDLETLDIIAIRPSSHILKCADNVDRLELNVRIADRLDFKW